MTTLIVARHGETDWNFELRWQGHADTPLNERGRAQARRLATALAGRGIEAVYSSDLARARETAMIIAETLALEVRLDPRLREVDVGEWSGLTTADVERLYPDGHRRRREGGTGWSAGEPFDLMSARVLAALRAIASENPGSVVLLVTHGGPLRAARAACGDEHSDWTSAGNCDMDVFAVEDTGMRWLDSTRGGLHQQVQG
jgi:broad specificity phosphatase PhoE